MNEKVIDYEKMNALMYALEEWLNESGAEIEAEAMLLLIDKLLQFTEKEIDE